MIRLFFLLFLLPISALAEIGLVLWEPEGYPRTFVLAARSGESPAQARDRYLNALEADPQLKIFAQDLRAVNGGKFMPFKSPSSPLVLVLANNGADHLPAQERLVRVSAPLMQKGASILVAPVAVTAGLKAEEVKEFQGLVNKEVDLLLAVGGADIHPSLYGDADPTGLAKETLLARDKEELEIVRSYLTESRGFFSGICRGHQMGGVASDCSLVKDIEIELSTEHPKNINHRIIPAESGDLTKRLFGKKKNFEVSSRHHQAVAVPSRTNPRIKVTAVSARNKKIAEVSEYVGGRGISVQGHPEDPNLSEFHKRYYDLVFEEAKRASWRRGEFARSFNRLAPCPKLFRSL